MRHGIRSNRSALYVATIAVVSLFTCSCNKAHGNDRDRSEEEVPKPRAQAKASTSDDPPPAPQRTILDDVAGAPTLKEAIAVVKPHMDDTDGETSFGAKLLAIWAAPHLRWADLGELPETRFALVQKDADEERGKRLCTQGTIIEIETAKQDYGKVFLGGIFSNSDVVRFIAVGKSGTLVSGSWARICGVVVGTESYKNSGGGTTHGVRIVGMFDLAENRPKSDAGVAK